MAQSGYTPILIYGSGTASNIPSAANLTSSANGAELALNYADGKLYYKNSAGTVTLLADKISVSVASANGFAGSVSQATATSTPAITISTTVTGVLKGNGTAISAAVSGTDYAPATSGTSILYGNGAGGFSNVTIGTGVSFAAGTLSATGTGGTVTAVSVASANGFAGTSSGGATPALTLSTSVTGVLVGNGTAVAAAVSGTDFKTINSTSILGSGNISITSTPGGATTQVQYNNAGAFAGSANMTFNGTSLTLANGASIQGLTVGKGAGAVSTNTAVGASALAANTSGAENTAFGNSALTTNTTGASNVAVGSLALGFANTNTGSGHVAIGSSALRSNSSGTANTAVGGGVPGVNPAALQTNTTGSYNTALGNSALGSNTTASNNTAVGYQAGYSNTTGLYLTAIGTTAGYTSSTANYQTFIGFQAGYTSNFSGSGGNTAIGAGAGFNLTTGKYNTFIGPQGQVANGSGGEITTGSRNTIIGAYNGNQSGLDIRTSNNYIVLSDGDGNPRMYFDTNGIANLRSSMLEQMTISATAATGTINFDAITQSVLYYTTNASGNFTMNVRGSSGVTLNNSMVTGQSLTIAFLCTNGSTAYYQTAMTIDGTSVTPKWQGGTAPSAGNASSIDSYVYTIIKTGAATFTVLASQTKFA